MIHPLAGQPAPKEFLANIPRLISNYYTRQPDAANAVQRVVFGTSGHRGTSGEKTFNEAHILAICQALCEYRQTQKISGPLFMGMDTHALSEPAMATALEVLAANGVQVMIQAGLGYTPTPVISHAILSHNRHKTGGAADGVVITPSHNPPTDGGFKYNPPSGGPAGTEITKVVQERANKILTQGLAGVKRILFEKAIKAETTHEYDYITPYVNDLGAVIRMDAIAKTKLKIGVDPMGGAAVAFWSPIAERYGLNIEVVNPVIDPTFSFMPLDHDGKIRMDCSSPYAMHHLIGLKDRFDIAFGNDPDVDRHGIVTRSVGLLPPNHYLAVAIWYLYQNRPNWPVNAAIGKTLVSSSMIDRIAKHLGRTLAEVPVGFKWFVDGLRDSSFGFSGEESAGASFLRLDGSVWTTDKDGFILDLLAAEITAVTNKDPGQWYQELEARFGSPVYERVDVPANATQKKVLGNLSPELIHSEMLANDRITAILTTAPWNQAAIDGLKVTTANGWFAARPSGTEDAYKIYAESFQGKEHLKILQEEAMEIVGAAFKAVGV